MELIYEASRLVGKYESIPRKYGTDDELYMMEAHTLDLIGNHHQITTSEMAEKTNRTTSAASQIVDKLTKKGLVVKHRNPNNHRELLIELTSKGRVVYEYHKKLDEEQYGKFLVKLGDFTVEDFQTISKFMISLREETRKTLENKSNIY
jgi:DNA-binding MarR family transcriptional regulator